MNSAPSQRPRISRQGNPRPAEQSVRPPSESCVLPQHSKRKPVRPVRVEENLLRAAVPFYGGQPASADVAKIKAAILLQFAANDERVNAGWPAYEEALKKAGVRYTAHHYPGANHGFHNDTTPRYNEAAANLAWQRTVEFFNKELGGK